LDVGDVRGHDHDLADQLLAALELDDEGVGPFGREVPVQVVVVVESGFGCAGADDAVGMRLDPTPERVEREGGGRVLHGPGCHGGRCYCRRAGFAIRRPSSCSRRRPRVFPPTRPMGDTRPGLRELQRLFWRSLAAVPGGGRLAPGLVEVVAPGPALDASARVGVYVDAYVGRLRDVLREDFPRV